MDTLIERLGVEGMCLIGLGICAVLGAISVERKILLGSSYERKCWKLVEFDELVHMIRDRHIQLFDVRERKEVAVTGLIPAATNIPLGELESALRMADDQFEDKYAVTKPHKDDLDIVTHCLSGKRSKQAMQKLHNLGYIFARTYGGGWQEYSILRKKVHVFPIHNEERLVGPGMVSPTGSSTVLSSNEEYEAMRAQGDPHHSLYTPYSSEEVEMAEDDNNTEFTDAVEPEEIVEPAEDVEPDETVESEDSEAVEQEESEPEIALVEQGE